MLDHQLQANYGLGPLEVLSLLYFQYMHRGNLPGLAGSVGSLLQFCVFHSLSYQPQLLQGSIFFTDMEVAHLRSLKVESY